MLRPKVPQLANSKDAIRTWPLVFFNTIKEYQLGPETKAEPYYKYQVHLL